MLFSEMMSLDCSSLQKHARNSGHKPKKNHTNTTQNPPFDPTMSLTQSFLDHGSKKRTEDPANASSRVGKRARTGAPNVKPKRQKRTEKSQASTKTKIGKSTRKVDWRAAEDNGSFRSAAERSAKKEKWEGKLSRCKNAFAKNIVENAFAAETPPKWTGKRFAERTLTKEKKVTYQIFDSASGS